MKKTIWAGVTAAAFSIAAISLGAQTTSPSTSQDQTKASGPEQRITVTGCLREDGSGPAASVSPIGDGGAAGAAGSGTTGTTGTGAGSAGAAGTTGTAAAPGSAATQPRFVLTNATASTPESSASGAASSAPASSGKTFKLIANGEALKPHVGHKLELTGTLESDSAASASTSGSSTGATSVASAASSAPKLRVESGKVLAMSCSE